MRLKGDDGMKDVGEQLAERLKKLNWNKDYRQLINDAFNDVEVKEFIKENQGELSQEDIARSASKVYEFVSVKNKIKRGEETHAPGYDPQLTLNNHLIDVTYIPSEALLLQKKSRLFTIVFAQSICLKIFGMQNWLTMI